MTHAESKEALALVESEIALALKPYVDLIAPLALAEMRAYLLDVALLHPTVSEMVERLAPRAPLLESGDVSKDPDGDVDRLDRDSGRQTGGGK